MWKNGGKEERRVKRDWKVGIPKEINVKENKFIVRIFNYTEDHTHEPRVTNSLCLLHVHVRKRE